MRRRIYPSDLSDEQWMLLEPLFPSPAPMGRPWVHGCREIVNTILYQSRTGCQWRHLPHDLPPRSTVFDWFARWRTDGTWDQAVDALRAQVRIREGRAEQPSSAVLDSQTVPNAGPADEVRYDGGKGVRGRKRHVLVDLLGLLIAVAVTSAYVSDLSGGHQLLQRARLTNGLLGVVSCDSAYQGLARRAARLRFRIDVIKNPSRNQFVAVYPRWIVERSFAWLSAHRRLGQRDLEHTIESAETWVKVAAIAFMLDRLVPKPDSPQSRTQIGR